MEYLVRDIAERPLIFSNTGTRFILIAIAWSIPIIAAGLAGSSNWQLGLIILVLYIIAYRRIVRSHYDRAYQDYFALQMKLLVRDNSYLRTNLRSDTITEGTSQLPCLSY